MIITGPYDNWLEANHELELRIERYGRGTSPDKIHISGEVQSTETQWAADNWIKDE